MRKLWQSALILVFAVSCSSLSEKDCQNGDWAAIGKRDGERGMSDTRIQSHQKACSEYGITIDESVYQSSRKEGLVTYCQRTGMSHGKKGQMDKTPAVCQSSRIYKTARKEGYKDFCHGKGIEAGKIANLKHAPKSCRKYSKYKTGWKEGITQYCSEENALNIGSAGGSHQGRLCPRSLRRAFMRSFDKGISQYCTREKGFQFAQEGQDINPKVCPRKYRKNFSYGYKKGLEYKNIKNNIADLNTKIDELEGKITDEKTSADLRAYLKKEMQEKMEQKKNLEKTSYKIEGAVGI